MKKLAVAFLFVITALGVFAPFGFAQQQIKEIKKIYLAPFGNDVESDLIREKIRTRLINSNHFVLVETADQADAIFTGVADIEKVENSTISGINKRGKGGIWGSSETDFNAVGVFRLVHPESKVTLWIYDYKPKWYRVGSGFNTANSEYNRIAKRVVEKLLKDAGEVQTK